MWIELALVQDSIGSDYFIFENLIASGSQDIAIERIFDDDSGAVFDYPVSCSARFPRYVVYNQT